MVAQLSDYSKNYGTVPFKWVSCMIIKLYVNQFISKKERK
jgi:hypothetical protein